MKTNILILSGFLIMLLVLPSARAKSQFGIDIESGYVQPVIMISASREMVEHFSR